MAKIKSYPKADKFSPGDVLLKDGPGGTMQIDVDDIAKAYMASDTEADTASKDYSKGDYLMANSMLCKVLLPISAGDAILPGVNVIETTITRELADLREYVYEHLEQEYDTLEYIQGTQQGKAWINTGLLLDGSLEFELDVATLGTGSICSFVTAHKDASKNAGRQGFTVFDTNSHRINYYWDGIEWSTLDVDPNIDLSKPFRVIQTQSGILVTQGIISQSASYEGGTGTNDAPVTLLHSDNPNHQTYGSGRLYSVKIRRNGELVRDYIPRLRKIDHVAGLYDHVTGEFHVSSGSEDLIPGPVL